MNKEKKQKKPSKDTKECKTFVSNYHLCEACGHNCTCGSKTGCDLCIYCREKLDNGEPIY